MKRITYKTPVTADLWIRLAKRMDKKNESLLSLSVCKGKLPEIGELDDKHWFMQHISIDVYMSEVKYKFSSMYVDMLDTIYNLLSDGDKKIIDDYIEEEFDKEMLELHHSLLSDDPFNGGIYNSDDLI